MKYLKKCENDIIGTYGGYRFLGLVAGQPKDGPTVILFKNPNTEETNIAYTGKHIFKEDESPIQYTWRYEYYNGHPAIILNFSRIDSGYHDNIICLESNNMAKGSGNGKFMGENKYKLNGENNNRSLNVITHYQTINTDNNGLTWYRLGDIELNKDYPIYITVPVRYAEWAKSKVFNEGKNDWEVRINIRPTIRCNFDVSYSIVNTFTFRHTNHIPAKEYMTVKFPYIDIFNA